MTVRLKHKIKRGERKRPPLAYFAPQCGAFSRSRIGTHVCDFADFR